MQKIFEGTETVHLLRLENNVVLLFLDKKIGHPVLKLHGIIHQANLCRKVWSTVLNDVLSTITKISLSRSMLRYTESFGLCLKT